MHVSSTYRPQNQLLPQGNLSATASYTFSAKEKDSETGLSYFGARYYSSDLSIWLSVDPMSDSYPYQSNYVYCSNNPLNITDPNGMFETRAEARKYRREHHTGGIIKKNSDNDGFSGNYSIENKRTSTFYTKPKYEKTDDVPIYGQSNDGIVSGPIIYSNIPSKSGTVMASTLIICAGLQSDDVFLIGVLDDPLIPVIMVAGVTISSAIYLFKEHNKHPSKATYDKHTRKRSGGDPQEGRYGKTETIIEEIKIRNMLHPLIQVKEKDDKKFIYKCD